MKKIQSLILGVTLAIGSFAVPLFVVQTTAGAVPISDTLFKACKGGTASPTAVCKDTGTTGDSMIKTVVNLLLYALGVISVIAIIVGGIRYTTSGGSASGINTARETILYGVVGVIVGLMAWSIVNFVVGNF